MRVLVLTMAGRKEMFIEVLGMREQTILLHVAAAAKPLVGHGQVEDQALGPVRNPVL